MGKRKRQSRGRQQDSEKHESNPEYTSEHCKNLTNFERTCAVAVETGYGRDAELYHESDDRRLDGEGD